MDVETDARMRGPSLPHEFRQMPHLPGFAAADVDVAREFRARRGELGFGLVQKPDDLLGPLPQAHPVRGEGHAVALALEQTRAQFLLQVGQLPGQGGLGDVQGRCRRSDVALAGHGEKVVEHADFHVFSPLKC